MPDETTIINIKAITTKDAVAELEKNQIIKFQSEGDKKLFNQLLNKPELEILDIKTLEHIMNRMSVIENKLCKFSEFFLDNDKNQNDYLNLLLLDKIGVSTSALRHYYDNMKEYSSTYKEVKIAEAKIEALSNLPYRNEEIYDAADRQFAKIEKYNGIKNKYSKSMKNFMNLYLNNKNELSFSFLPENEKKPNVNQSNRIDERNEELHDKLSKYYLDRDPGPNKLFTRYGKDSKLKETLRIMKHIDEGKSLEDYKLKGASKDGKLGQIIKAHLQEIRLASGTQDGIELRDTARVLQNKS